MNVFLQIQSDTLGHTSLMKIKSLLLMVLLAALFCGVAPRQAEARVTFSYFYDSLMPYGDWVDVENYGYCWQPRSVDPAWRPYTDGYWSYTDAGWTWVSYEDFGSITYHYGRWVRLEGIGWVWQPGYEWGPAWVSWRQSDDYIGWAPLPPEANFDEDAGIGVWVDRDYDIGPDSYVFCEYRYFGAPVIRNYVLPWRRNVAIIPSTVNITNISVVYDGGTRIVFNGGLDYRRISPRVEHRIEMLHLMRQREGDWAQHHRSELSRKIGNQLYINAPEIEAPRTRFAPPTVARQIQAPKIDKGWSGVKDNTERERIRQHFHDETRGLTRVTAPARPVDIVQVQTLINQPPPTPPPQQGRDFHGKKQPGRSSEVQVPTMTPQQQQVPMATPQVQQQQMRTATPSQQVQPQPTVVAPTQPPQPPDSRHQRGKQQMPGTTPQVQQQQIQPQPAVIAPTPQPQQQHQAVDTQAQERAAREQQQQEQARRQQIQQQQAEQQQRQAAEAQQRQAREQQEQARRQQIQQQQAEQQRQAAEAQQRQAKEQQEQTRRQQAQQQQVEQQQRQAAEAQHRMQQMQQQQPERHERRQEQRPMPQQIQQVPQAQQSPSPDNDDHKKHHKDRDN